MVANDCNCLKDGLLCLTAVAVLAFASGCEEETGKTKAIPGIATDTAATATKTRDDKKYKYPSEILIDNRDGKKYKYAKIGEQTWMAENLNYNVDGSKCHDDLESNCDIFGRKYDFAMAMGLPNSCNTKTCTSQNIRYQGVCPEGWHIPNRKEWDELFLYADGISDTQDLPYPYRSNSAGNYLKSTGSWISGTWWSTEELNESYFEAFCSDDPKLRPECIPEPGFSSSNTAYYRFIRYEGGEAEWHMYEKTKKISVRCIKD